MKQNSNTNAANRSSYVGNNYNLGEKEFKKKILSEIKPEWAKLHNDGYIHIHDLDAYGQTYNCLTFNLAPIFPYKNVEKFSTQRKIIYLFDYIKSLLANLGNEQSGGMAFANFDNDIAETLENMNVDFNDKNKSLISDCIADLILWCNDTHTRMGQTSYYVTLNVGLAKNDEARFILGALLDEFYNSGDRVFKPNIVFKVHEGINRNEGDPNYSLFIKALNVTAKKMIPTYLLCDSKPNKDVDPYRLSIMGCRTRVVDDVFGEKGAIGRGNIDNISINMPRLALEINKEFKDLSLEEKLDIYEERWDDVANVVKDILLDRYHKLCKLNKTDFPVNSAHKLWCEDFNSVENLEEVFKHGTLSIGFIGLSETIEVLTNEKYYASPRNYMYTLRLVNHMRSFCNMLRRIYKLNFSLLATAGELISGRFIDIDKEIFDPKMKIFEKGFYTNSFHIDVDSGLPGYKKIKMEGLFHEICNGGCITYVELGEAPIGNAQGLHEYIEIAIDAGTHYLGFNFPKDICDECGETGVFDECPHCHSKKITRIRRVSGYLEILDGFTKGKKQEEKYRKENK